MDDLFSATPADPSPISSTPDAASNGFDFGGDAFEASAPIPAAAPAPIPDDFGVTAEPVRNSFAGEDMFSAPPPAAAEPAFEIPAPVSSARQAWEEESAQRLKAKQEAEAVAKAEIIAAADKERELFYAQRAKQIEAKQQTNREKEAVQAKSGAEDTWEAALNLTDGKPDGGADLTRMRQLLLKLKHKRSD